MDPRLGPEGGHRWLFSWMIVVHCCSLLDEYDSNHFSSMLEMPKRIFILFRRMPWVIKSNAFLTSRKMTPFNFPLIIRIRKPFITHLDESRYRGVFWTETWLKFRQHAVFSQVTVTWRKTSFSRTFQGLLSALDSCSSPLSKMEPCLNLTQVVRFKEPLASENFEKGSGGGGLSVSKRFKPVENTLFVKFNVSFFHISLLASLK